MRALKASVERAESFKTTGLLKVIWLLRNLCYNKQERSSHKILDVLDRHFGVLSTGAHILGQGGHMPLWKMKSNF